MPWPIGGTDLARRECGLERMAGPIVPIRVAPKPRPELCWHERSRKPGAQDRFQPVGKLPAVPPSGQNGSSATARPDLAREPPPPGRSRSPHCASSVIRDRHFDGPLPAQPTCFGSWHLQALDRGKRAACGSKPRSRGRGHPVAFSASAIKVLNGGSPCWPNQFQNSLIPGLLRLRVETVM